MNKLVLVLSAMLVAIGGLVVPAAAAGHRAFAETAHHAAASPSQLRRSGVFVSAHADQDLAFGKWRGRQIGSVTVFPPSTTWKSIERLPWEVTQWNRYPRVRPVLSYPMWTKDNLFGSLAHAASGAYDIHFATLGRHLVKAGLSHAILRIGWEFNGTWFPWRTGKTVQAADYAMAWRHIVTAMRQVPGQHFGFDWTVFAWSKGIDPALAYPGDAYVTEIGCDAYDASTYAHETPAARWHQLVHQRYGLHWLAGFAALHHQPIAFPEWALSADPLFASHGSGDDPMFIRNMYRWFNRHHVVAENYFNADTVVGHHSLTRGAFPRSAAVYRRLFSRR